MQGRDAISAEPWTAVPNNCPRLLIEEGREQRRSGARSAVNGRPAPICSTAAAWRWSVVTALAISACGSSDRHAEGMRHPVSSGRVRPHVTTTTLSILSDVQEQQAANVHVLTGIGSYEAAGTHPAFGVLDQPPEAVIGYVRDATVDSFGRVLVLDSRARSVVVFSNVGEYLQTLGRPGGGPGEFRDPQGVDATHDGLVFVFDAFGRVTVFRSQPDSLYLFRTFEVGFRVYDGCVMQDHVFLHGADDADPSAIRKHTLDGRPVSSFGVAYKTDNPVVARQLSRGRIACVEREGLVLWAPTLLPELHVYTAAGRLNWVVDLLGLRPIDLFEIPSGSGMRIPDGGYHAAASVVADDALPLAFLSIAHLERDSTGRRRTTEFLTVLLCVPERKALSLGSVLPRIVASQAGNAFVAHSLPYPHVRPVGLTIHANARASARALCSPERP